MHQTRFIDCKENGPLHNTLKAIGISGSSQFANGFLTRLSTRVPSLQEVKLDIDKKEIISADGGLYDIVMPFTNFSTLKVNIIFRERDNSSLRMDEHVNVKLVTNKYNNNNDDDLAAAASITQYYYYFVSAGSNSTTTQTTRQLNLKHVCNDSCQHSDEDIMICSRQTCYNIRIQGIFSYLEIEYG